MTKLYEVTFFKKCSKEIEVIMNIIAEGKEDAVGLLIDIDNNEEDTFLGLENLEYSIKVL